MYLDHYCLPNNCNTSLQNIIISQLPQEKKKVEVFIWICLLFKNKVPLFYINNYQQTHSKVPDKSRQGGSEVVCKTWKNFNSSLPKVTLWSASVLTSEGSVYWGFSSNVRHA